MEKPNPVAFSSFVGVTPVAKAEVAKTLSLAVMLPGFVQAIAPPPPSAPELQIVGPTTDISMHPHDYVTGSRTTSCSGCCRGNRTTDLVRYSCRSPHRRTSAIACA